METVQGILKGDGVLTIEALKELGRNSLRKVFSGHEAIPKGLESAIWTRLHQTACSPVVSDKHLTAACNAICVFLNGACRSTQDKVREYGFSKEIWFEGLEIVHRAFNDGKNKPGVQILETLVSILHDNADEVSARGILQEAVNGLVHVVILGKPEIRLKEACIVLLCFLKKSAVLLPFSQYFLSLTPSMLHEFKFRCVRHNIRLDRFDIEHEELLSVFLLSLLFTVRIPESRTAALKLFSFVCSKGEKQDYLENVPKASRLVQMFISANTDELTEFANELFPSVLNDKEQFRAFIEPTGVNMKAADTMMELDILLAIFEVGRRKGLIEETEMSSFIDERLGLKSTRCETTIECVGGFDMLLSCKNQLLRLQAYNLLTMSSMTNSLVSMEALDCVARNYQSLHDDSDAYYRDEYLSITRRFFIRLDRSAQAAQRKHSGSHPNDDICDTVQYYRTFLLAYLSFLKLELGPHTSYPRHILALNVLHRVLELQNSMGLGPEADKIVGMLIRPLLSLAMDPFEDVRNVAISILQLIHRADNNIVSVELNQNNLVIKAEVLSAKTNRGDHADALGRLLMLQESVSKPQWTMSDGSKESKGRDLCIFSDLADYLRSLLAAGLRVKPTDGFPLHGKLLGGVYCIDEINTTTASMTSRTIDDALNVCSSIWQLVYNDLCVDSPEKATEDEELESNTGPKDLLAYSWRALRDSSLVMQALLRANLQYMTPDFYRQIGDLCSTQLTDLRHRGAFSTVAQTFVLCCQKVRSYSHDATLVTLHGAWTQAAFEEIENQATRLTRRSAGLPAMFAALLDPDDPKGFTKIVRRLTAIAGNTPPILSGKAEVRLPQVHALNCLKDIMLSSRFRVVTESLVVPMLNLAANGLASDIWAIRNCGLMLFRACINRLTPEASVTFTRQNDDELGTVYETPLMVATKMLDDSAITANRALSSDNDRLSETVFAALDLLGRIPVYSQTKDLVNSHFTRQLQSPLWSVREHAARLRASTATGGDEMATIRTLLSPTSMATSNELHGRFLCVQYIFQNLSAIHSSNPDNRSTVEIITMVQSFLQEFLSGISNVYVVAAVMDVLNDIYGQLLASAADTTLISRCSDLLLSHIDTGRAESYCPLLERAVMLNKVYCILQDGSSPLTGDANINEYETRSSAAQIVMLDLLKSPDTTSYVVRRLTALGPQYQSSALRSFLVGVILNTRHEDASAIAIKGLATLFSTLKEGLTMTQMQQLAESIDLRNPGTRELLDTRALLASHIAGELATTEPENPTPLLRQVIGYAQEALGDVVEMPTRFSAVSALSSLLSYIARLDYSVAATETDHLESRLLLYEYLNDDDEEIRGIAVDTTQEFVDHLEYRSRGSEACTVVTRETLSTTISLRYGNFPTYVAHCCNKIIGSFTPTALAGTDSLTRYCATNTVVKMIAIAVQKASDLFAEEKQNLYVDEVSEIKTWSEKLQPRHLNLLGEQQIASLTGWAREGIQQLVHLLRLDGHGVDGFGPLGPTYNEDVLIIFLRVITMEGVLLKRLQSLQVERDDAQSDISSKRGSVTDPGAHLLALQSLCQEHNAHELVLDAINTALCHYQ